MPSENEMFYGKIQKGLDRWKRPPSSAARRAYCAREALDEVGGFSGAPLPSRIADGA